MLLRLYRSLIPCDATFIQRFCDHSRKVVQGAEAFRAMMEGMARSAGITANSPTSFVLRSS